MENSTSPIQGSIHAASAGEPAGAGIRFGTDGWRERIGDGFTFAEVRRCAAGIAAYLRGSGRAGTPVAIGYDGRFLSDRFAREAARVLAGEGFVPILSPEPVPTPALSWRVTTARASLGIMITASHNPPEYSGVKLKAADGGTLDPAHTERMAASIPPRDPGAPAVEIAGQPSFIPSYLKAIKDRVALKEIRAARLRVLADSMHGMGGLLLERVLEGGRVRVRTLRSGPDPLFGGSPPEPMPHHLQALRAAVRREKAAAGFATDGDGDRLAAVDDRGKFLSPLTLLPVLARHLIEVRGERGGIAKTFAGSLRMERIARRHNLPFHDLPVGFKHVASLLREGAILVGGEESGGFGFRGFIPERDGILSSLMILEAMVLADCSLSVLVARMEREYGRFAYDRRDLHRSPAEGRRLTDRLAARPPRRIAGLKVTAVNRLDGVKLMLGEEGWLLFRQSGTEPVLRLYCEAPTPALVAAALRHAARIAGA